MAATLDKENIVKHSFWILAGGYIVLVLVALFVLMTSVGHTVEDEKDKLKKAQKLITDVPGKSNASVVDAYKKQDQLVADKKDEVWRKAWETQKDMMTWPRDLQTQFQKYKYFGQDIDQFDRAAFDEKYPTQFEEVWKVVDPVLSNGEGVVQCKAPWTELLQFDRTFEKKPPSKDDIWLTQEDLWVKREMLRIIHDANQSVARFKEVTANGSGEKEKEVKPAAPPEKEDKATKPETATAPQEKAVKPAAPAAKTDPNHKIFRNPYWEFDLTLVGPDRGKFALRGKLTNISKHKQPLDTKFKVFLQDPRTIDEPAFQPISVGGLPLAVGDSTPIDSPVQETKAIEGLFGVEQLLNWRTAAVKRLDDLKLMYPSSRTAARTLKPPRFINTNPDSGDSSAAGDAAAQTAGATPGGPTSPLGAAVAAITTQTLNGLEINRYTDVSEQVRHMPVAMVVVVDEDDLPELLAAFVNSKLRIQITQYHWHHCRDRMNPQFNENEGGTPQVAPSSGFRGGFTPTPSITRPGTPMASGRPYGVNNPLLRGGGERGATRPGGPGMPYSSGPPGRMPGPPGPIRAGGPSGPVPGMRTGFGPAGLGSVPDGEEEQEDLNLLEVAVYGLASLYERYPPQPKAAESGASEEKKAADNAADAK